MSQYAILFGLKSGDPSCADIPFAISEYISKGMNLELNTWCGPEAQVASLSDDIAYFSHDIEDGIRAGFFKIDDILKQFTILKTFMRNIEKNKYKLETRRIVNEIKRYIISKLINDLILETKRIWIWKTLRKS